MCENESFLTETNIIIQSLSKFMKVYFKSGVLTLLGVALTLSVSSCHDDDPDYSNVTPPAVSEIHVISGSIAAMDGSGIAGATVTMSGAATATATTDGNGYFIFSDVNPGNYTLSATATGKLSKETSVSISENGKGQNAVWNVMLASEESVTSIPVSTEDGGEGDVTSEALKGNDLAEIPIEVEVAANSLDKNATITVSPIYSEAEAAQSRAAGHTMLIGADIDCSDKSVKIVNPIELSFEVDPETIEAIKTQKYVNGSWVEVGHKVVDDKIIIAADEFTSYALFGGVQFSTQSTNQGISFSQSSWDNLYGSTDMNVSEASYTYKVGMDIKSQGTTVFTALLIEALARHYGANSYETKTTYPINVVLPIGTYLGISGVQQINTVTASLGRRSVSGTQYGDVTISVVTANRQHNGGSSLPR